MSREKHIEMLMEGLIMPNKNRKRGCSSSSSSSSKIRSYRLNKRVIRVGKNRAGHGIGSRFSTPVPSATESSKHSVCGKSLSQPVSARRLAATLWEMNEMPSPRMSESNLDLKQKKNNGSKMLFKREKMHFGWGLHPDSGSGSGSGSLLAHFSDQLHSPTVSEKMDRLGTASCQRTPTISQRLRSAEQSLAAFDSISNASFTESETRSRPPTSSGSVSGDRNRLKDISNALTTSKELLKIINRIWAHADQPPSSMSVISALHAELERARQQVNHLIQEKNTSKTEINYLMKCFAQEKASWKNKEHKAIESVAGELEVERKLRKRAERLNKELGKELAEMKVKSKMVKVHQEAEKEQLEATHQFEEKNSAIGKLRKQLEVVMGSKKDKDDDRVTYSTRAHIDHEIKARRSTSILRSVSEGVQEIEREAERRSYCEERERYKAIKGLRDHVLSSNSRFSSPRQGEQSLPLRDTCGSVDERFRATSSKSRMGDVVRGEGQSSRRSRW